MTSLTGRRIWVNAGPTGGRQGSAALALGADFGDRGAIAWRTVPLRPRRRRRSGVACDGRGRKP